MNRLRGRRSLRLVILAVSLSVATAPTAAAKDSREVLSLAALRVRGFCSHLFTSSRPRAETATTAGVNAKVSVHFGYVPAVRIQSDESAGQIAFFLVRAFDRDNRELGSMVIHRPSPYLVHLGRTWVEPFARNQGVSELMFTAAVAQVPRVIRVTTNLTELNRERILADVAGGTPCREAVLDSYGAKMLARFGFTELVVEPECGREKIIRLQLERRAFGAAHYRK